MSFWKKNPSSSKPNAPTIRIEKVAIKTSSGTVGKAPPRSQSQGRPGPSRIKSNSSEQTSGRSTNDNYTTKLNARKTYTSRKRSPAYQRVESDTSDDEGAESPPLSKRQRLASSETEDPNRSLRSRKQFSQVDSEVLIHAADIASHKLGFRSAFERSASEGVSVYLQYPGSLILERYALDSRLTSAAVDINTDTNSSSKTIHSIPSKKF